MRFTLAGVAFVVFVASLLYMYTGLPDRLVSHFSVSGQPDSWSSRTDFVGLMGALGVFIPCIIYFPVAALPLSYVNVPNKSYWLAAEHQAEMRLRLKKSMMEMVILMEVFFTVMCLTVVYANSQATPEFPATLAISFLGAFIIGTGVQMIGMIRRFQLPKSDGA